MGVVLELKVNEVMFPDKCIRAVNREYYLVLDDTTGDLNVFNHPPPSAAAHNWSITLTSTGQVVKSYQGKPVAAPLGKPLPQDPNYKLVVDHKANACVKIGNDFKQDLHVFHIFDWLEEYFKMYSDTCIRSRHQDCYLVIGKDKGELVISDTPRCEMGGSYYIMLTQRGNVVKYDSGGNFLKGYGQLLEVNDGYTLDVADNSKVLVMLEKQPMQRIDLP